MRGLVAGASGVVGQALLPVLTTAGHEVVGMVHSGTAAATVRALGARVERADALDRSAVRPSMGRSRPHAVVDPLTAIPVEVPADAEHVHLALGGFPRLSFGRRP